MVDVDMTGVILKEVNFQRARIKGLILKGAVLDGVNFTNTVIEENINISEAKIIRLIDDEIVLTEKDLTGKDITETNLLHAKTKKLFSEKV